MEKLSKQECEEYEIVGFITVYKNLEHGRKFTVVETREKPDRIVEDIETGERFGIELTSEYLSDRSVPDRHLINRTAEIPDDPKVIEIYEKRIIERIKKKVSKAREGYDLSYPLILSIYLNEYESIYMDEEYWREFAIRYDKFFDNIEPFEECVFWPLPNELVVSVRK